MCFFQGRHSQIRDNIWAVCIDDLAIQSMEAVIHVESYQASVIKHPSNQKGNFPTLL